MDTQPLPRTEEVVQALREDPSSLFSRTPKDLDAQIGKYVLKIYCPAAEKLTEADARAPKVSEFELRDTETSLTFKVSKDGGGQYKFDSVDVIDSPNKKPFIQCNYKTLEGRGRVSARLNQTELASKQVVSCQGAPAFRVEERPKDFFHYGTKTSNARDIAITCLTK